MNSSPFRHDPLIDERAAYWAARLDGGDVLEARERAELDAWLAESPAHRAALSDYCQFSADLEEQLPALVEAGAVAMPEAPRKSRSWFSLPVFSGLAVAAAAALAVVVYMQRPEPVRVQNVVTAIAQRSTQVLADGTRVELNARTSLRFENGEKERRVRLADGEALFAVAKDPSRPFLIETNYGSVRVTGTTFNVRNGLPGSATSLEVTVVEGSVQVRPGRGTEVYALKANDQLLAGSSGVHTQNLTAGTLANALAWREGNIVFTGTSLQEAAAHFARYHGRRVVVDPAIAAAPVGGLHRIDDFDGWFFEQLPGIMEVNVTKDAATGTVTLTKR
ncbi:MAG TPA: FecR domain-containing protein [Opitutaceae bacterium]